MKRPWKEVIHHGSWIPGKSAGGGPDSSTFAMNPQFRLTVIDPDLNDRDNTGNVQFLKIIYNYCFFF